MKLHVVFDKNGDKVGDKESMDYALSKLNRVKGTNQEYQVDVANALVIYCFRILVKEGKISPSELVFYHRSADLFLDNPITVDKNGEISRYPKGFADAHADVLFKLIT